MRLHSLIFGCTLSGKSTLAKVMAKGFRERGVCVAVLDPLKDRNWDADFVTENPDQFLHYAKRSHSHQLFVDEGATAIGRYNAQYQWLTTTARHHGHCATIICNRPQQLDKTLRDQCTTVYVFACSKSDAAIFADDFNEPLLLEAVKFKPGQFMAVGRFADTCRGQIDFKRGTVRYEPATVTGKVAHAA